MDTKLNPKATKSVPEPSVTRQFSPCCRKMGRPKMNHPVVKVAEDEKTSLMFRNQICSTERESTEMKAISLSDNENPPEKSDIYNISYTGNEIDPWSIYYAGIPLNYFAVGLMVGGSTSILYPVLVVKHGVSSSLVTASTSIVTLFWSYKIFFGLLTDCFPIFGFKKKPYIVLGWILCSLFLMRLASLGNEISATNLVLMLVLANFGYVMSDVASDGFMVMIAHQEPIHRRGRMQTLVYACNKFGEIIINLVILFGFSGPRMNCPGYQANPALPCTTDLNVMQRNELYENNPDTWCYMKCSSATFDFGVSVHQFYWIIIFVNIISLPFYVILRENHSKREQVGNFMKSFWGQLKRKAVWRIILYSMVSHITFGVSNAAKIPANYIWLNLRTSQYQIMIILEKCVFLIGLNLIRRYALHFSWRKMILAGAVIVTCFNALYFLIVFDIWRNVWFYMVTDVSVQFMYTLNFLSSVFCIVEVAEPGFEAITYSLITTASNSVAPLSSVISYQLLAFFPELNSQESLATDTSQIRWQFATLHVLAIVINLSSLLALPMLPRQKKETRELVALGETSAFWGGFALFSGLIFLIYSTIVTFVTVAGSDVYGCYKIFGGKGCTETESSIPAYALILLVFIFCYGVNFYHTFWPILTGREKWSFSMFI